MKVRCPTDPTPYDHPRPHDPPEGMVGCGQEFEAELDDEGFADCPNCGLFFKPRPQDCLHTRRILQVTLVNETKGYRLEESEIDLADTYMGEDTTPGEIFREMQREYGRCTSKVYIDDDGPPKAVGWHFEKIDHYDDTGGPYLRGAWVMLLTVTIEREDIAA